MTHQHKINKYTCKSCVQATTTIDLHEGVTPFMITCPKCGKLGAESVAYHTHQEVDADMIWYRPTTGKETESEHVRLGGLVSQMAREPLKPVRLQKSPNQASCLPTSFAMVLGVPVAELLEQLGHNGTEIVSPQLSVPNCYRGFHVQELIFACLERGYAVTPFEPLPVLQLFEKSLPLSTPWWFERILSIRNGILLNDHHAVAWSHGLIYDPAIEQVRALGDFAIRTFYAVVPQARVTRICQNPINAML